MTNLSSDERSQIKEIKKKAKEDIAKIKRKAKKKRILEQIDLTMEDVEELKKLIKN